MRGSGRTGALALVFVVLATTCSAPLPATIEQPDPDGAITSPVQGLPVLIDPLFFGTDVFRHTAMVFEGLMTFDPATPGPVPAAARDQPKISADGLTYTFRLRDGLNYSDGSPLRAKDFAYAFARICEPGRRSPPLLAPLIAGCEALRRLDPKKASAAEIASTTAALGVKANDDLEFTVVLTRPLAFFTALATLPLLYPVRETDVLSTAEAGIERPVEGQYGTASALASFVGNGPFKLIEWTPERMVFERNDHYRSPAKLKRWTKVVVPPDVGSARPQTTALAAYKNGEIDFFGGVPSRRVASVNEHLDEIERDPQLVSEIIDAGPAAITDAFILNVSRPPFSDRSVRQAFAKAIDRDGIAASELLRFTTPARSLIPPGRPGHDPEDRFQSYDPVQARDLLRSSTFAGGPEMSSIKVVYADATTRTPAEILQQQLKATLRIEIGLELVSSDAFNAMYRDPQTAPQIRFARLGEDFTDPEAWFAAFHSASPLSRAVRYRNPQLDALLDGAAIERDPARRADLHRQASRILSEDAFVIWFLWPSNVYLRKARVRGVTDTPSDYEYGLRRLTDIYVTKGS